MKVAITNINGVQTRICYAGSGYPLLFLHGMHATADTWLPNIDALAKDFTVYAPDMIGRGLTDFVDLEKGPPQPKEVDHLLALIDHLGLEKFSIIGGSYGGLIGSLIYFARPQNVDRLVYVSSGSSFNTDEQQERMLDSIEERSSRMFGPVQSLEDCRRRFSSIVWNPNSLPEAMLIMIANLNAQPKSTGVYNALMSGFRDAEKVRPYRIINRFSEINLPVLIINGRDDFLSLWERSAEVSRELSNVKLEIWEKCGHLPNIEYSDRFNKAITGFFSNLIKTNDGDSVKTDPLEGIGA